MDAIEKEVERVAAKVPSLYASPASASQASASSSSSPSPSKRPATTAARAKVSSTSSGSATVETSLDDLLSNLESIRSSLAGPATSAPSPPVVAAEVKSLVSQSQKTISDRHKEVYNALSKLGKAYDKKFPTAVGSLADPSLFTGDDAQKALGAVIADHLLRIGERDAAHHLAMSAALELPASDLYSELDHVSRSLTAGSPQPAMEWAAGNRSFLKRRNSPLEFALHRSQFIRIALGQASGSPFQSDPAASASRSGLDAMALDPDGENVPRSGAATPASSPIELAVQYGRAHFRRHMKQHMSEVQALYSFILYLPSSLPSDPDAGSPSEHLQYLYETVPFKYHRFLDNSAVHAAYLVPLFQADFCAYNHLARDAPLQTAVEVGASGALTKILKVRQVMKMRGNEWSQANELPIDIPLPPHLRFHSTFTCPVSKEQATEENPPMMMLCGHVVCAESLARLGKGTHGRLKCCYCPTESTVSQAVRLYF